MNNISINNSLFSLHNVAERFYSYVHYFCDAKFYNLVLYFRQWGLSSGPRLTLEMNINII